MNRKIFHIDEKYFKKESYLNYFKFHLSQIPIKWQIFIEKIQGLDFTEVNISVTTLGNELGIDEKLISRGEATIIKYLDRLISGFNIKEDDAIIDIGCAKGKAIRTLNKFPFAKIDGIEISEKLSEIARNNLKKLGITKTQIFAENALTFLHYDEYNYIYMYNPFPSEIMVQVLEKIVESVKSKPRKIIIIYNNPCCHQDILNTIIFKKTSEYKSSKRYKFYIYTNILD